MLENLILITLLVLCLVAIVYQHRRAKVLERRLEELHKQTPRYQSRRRVIMWHKS